MYAGRGQGKRADNEMRQRRSGRKPTSDAIHLDGVPAKLRCQSSNCKFHLDRRKQLKPEQHAAKILGMTFALVIVCASSLAFKKSFKSFYELFNDNAFIKRRSAQAFPLHLLLLTLKVFFPKGSIENKQLCYVAVLKVINRYD